MGGAGVKKGADMREGAGSKDAWGPPVLTG